MITAVSAIFVLFYVGSNYIIPLDCVMNCIVRTSLCIDTMNNDTNPTIVAQFLAEKYPHYSLDLVALAWFIGEVYTKNTKCIDQAIQEYYALCRQHCKKYSCTTKH